MKDSMKVKGWFEIELIRNGEVVAKRKTKNTITNTGKAEMINLIGNVSTPTAFSYLAVGTDNTAAATSQTALGAEITDTGLARASATMSRITTSTTNDTLQFVKSWTASGAKAVVECGFFNAASVGIMGGRQVFSVINTANGDILQITYRVQLS